MKRILTTVAIAGAALVIGGCGGSSEPADAPPAAATTTAQATTTAPAATATTATTATAAAGAKVNANSASEDEIKTALEGAGVKNAEKWADEILEYRPYPADDPSFAKLREELAKYNPAPDELTKIVSVLTP